MAPIAALVPRTALSQPRWKGVADLYVELALDVDITEPFPPFVDYARYVLDEESHGSFNSFRGRRSPLQAFAPGELTVVFDMRDRVLEPDHNPDLEPRGQIRIRSKIGSTAEVVYRGYIDRMTPSWTGPSESILTVHALDLLDVLAQTDAPTSAWAAEVLLDIAACRVWYRLGEGVGTVMSDSSGNARDGVYSGTLAWGSGLAEGDTNGSLNCAAGDVRGAVPAAGKITASPYTIELSVNIPSTPDDSILYIQEDDFAVVYGVNNGSSTGYVALDCLLGSGGEMCRGALVAPGDHHIVFTRSLVGMRMWVDGVEQLPLIERGHRLPAGATATNAAGAASDPTAPAMVNATQGTGGTVTAPTNSAGDLIVVASYNGSSIAGGFTTLVSLGLGAVSLYYKISNGSEPASWAIGGANVSWVAASYSGVDPIGLQAFAVATAGTAAGTLNIPSANVPAHGCLILCPTYDQNLGGVNTPTSGFTSRGTASTTSSAVRLSDKTHNGGATGGATVTGITANGGMALAVFAPKTVGSPFVSILDEVVVYDGEISDVRIAAHAAAWSTAWAGDLTGTRVNRLLDLFGWSDYLREIDAGNSLMSAAQLGGSFLEAVRAAETAEQGRLFMKRDGTVIFRDRLSPSTRTTEAVVQAVYSR